MEDIHPNLFIISLLSPAFRQIARPYVDLAKEMEAGYFGERNVSTEDLAPWWRFRKHASRSDNC
jgi:hypothetical protein